MKFDFYGKRFICFIISGVIILAGLISIAVNGLKMDIQFKGGALIKYTYSGELDVQRRSHGGGAQARRG